MLYDPKWENETKTVPSLRGLIEWLETKNPKEKYNYDDCSGTCLVDLYGASIGIDCLAATPLAVFSTLEEYWCVAGDRPWTFGAALKRARKHF